MNPTGLVVEIAKSRLEVLDNLEEITTWKHYKQIFGTAIGSPVSTVVANLVMKDVEKRALSTVHFPPKIWKRYVL